MDFPSVPLKVNVLRIDLKSPFLGIETAKASTEGVQRLRAREKTSSIAARKTNDSISVIAAINGDFFDVQTGSPINIQIENGEVLKKGSAKPAKSIFGMTAEKKPFIGRFSFHAILLTREDSSLSIDNVNEICDTDEAVVFNKFYGERTGTSFYGVVVPLRPLSRMMVNDTVFCIVDTLIDLSGNHPIPQTGLVLIGRGKARGFVLRNISLRDTVKIFFHLTPFVGKVTQAIGGWPRIVRDGKNTLEVERKLEEAIPGNVDKRHPRTAVGISLGADTLYFVVVDGRQTSSVGMTLDELANLMVRLGAYDAINLDGGGSTTMVVNGRIVNSPSDPTGERPVANALIVTMKRK